MTELRDQKDPRVCDKECRFDKSPFIDVVHKKKGMEKTRAGPRMMQVRAMSEVRDTAEVAE
jgi:hypothetical protein